MKTLRIEKQEALPNPRPEVPQSAAWVIASADHLLDGAPEAKYIPATPDGNYRQVPRNHIAYEFLNPGQTPTHPFEGLQFSGLNRITNNKGDSTYIFRFGGYNHDIVEITAADTGGDPIITRYKRRIEPVYGEGEHEQVSSLPMNPFEVVDLLHTLEDVIGKKEAITAANQELARDAGALAIQYNQVA